MIHPKIFLKLVLEVGACNGTMSMSSYCNDKLLRVDDALASGNVIVSLPIELPSQLRLEVGNKNLGKDTIVDKNGNIIADKFILLKKLYFGAVEIPSERLKKIYKFTSDNVSIVDHFFWGENGVVSFDFNFASLVEWDLRSIINNTK